ncbi:hypothetical protein CDV52_15885 [Haematobacter missouriensis]|uniref:Uncharacterized protein n=1 Tax=Haematobacter missouriensis TaxID=366616 RepID=A0A225CPZ4_9RHOB|nr:MULTISPECIES: hypothetical protein [Haematobacter]OWJ69589.1 hypothetical protein CDV50_17210 [Haematobacter massiliensis]OWJ73813.1 hypothetical protein CDV53_14915 [Haematobacter missouriensis]OWJ82024.1 hypothetical protein CDV52_15885 [Haematobacter missouriensis]
MRKIYHRIYLAGYGGWQMPRRLRKLIAGTQAHRAWLLGVTGCFEQDGVRYGPAFPYGAAHQHDNPDDEWSDPMTKPFSVKECLSSAIFWKARC